MNLGYDCRDAFAEVLMELASHDRRVVAVTNDSVSSSKLSQFAARHRDRLINVGIAEQNLVGVSAGLALSGKVPFVCAAAPFLTARALEQIKVDVAYNQANVKLCAMSSGLAYGELGPTHHAIEDLAWMRALPNLVLVVPADPIETRAAVRFAMQHEGPVYLRLSRMLVPEVHGEAYHFEMGRAVVLRPGKDVTLAANGTTVWRCLEAARQLEAEGVDARVLNVSTLKPLDRHALEAAARETGGIVTVEEHTLAGGLGSAVAEVVVSSHPVAMRMLGIPGVFAPTGSAAWLMEYFGLTPERIGAAAKELLS